MADMVSVFHILHACWGKSSWWSHVKKVKGKNGRQVGQILHATLLGGDRITATSSAIVTKLQSFKYEGDQKNFNYDKYMTLHVEQHNQHSDLTEYGVKHLDESLKIHWFQDGIKCTTLDAVKAAITTNKEKYSKFDSVKDAYVDFKRTMTPTLDPRTQRDGSGRSRQTGRGAGQRTGDSRKKGLVPQNEIDKQTHITIRDYSPDEYKRLTPAEKAKLWQLRNPNKTPGTGPTKRDHQPRPHPPLLSNAKLRTLLTRMRSLLMMQAGAGTMIIRCLAARFVHVMRTTTDRLTPIT